MLYQKKNKTHQMMQREQLYNLNSKVYCNCFEKKENSIRLGFTTAKVRLLKTLSILKTKSATRK
jgi:hypothetical protein